MRLHYLASLVLAAILPSVSIRAEDGRQPLVPEDLYLLDGPQAVLVAPHADAAAIVRRWIDERTRRERFVLWYRKGDAYEPMEPGEPDARSASFSRDGKWLAIRSTRPRPNGWTPTPEVPPQSDAATDLWLLSTENLRCVPLAGPDKPYGRVFNDMFYGGVAFSPDGKRLAFIADDGQPSRVKEEVDANVVMVRSDQGEGYTGYRTAQLWIAELDEKREIQGAKSVRRLTHDDVWYGDPQWTPDGATIVVHANKSSDQEAVRYSINKNYDLWAIDVETGKQRRLTFGPGPEVSPRISASGERLVCLSSPRKGPHSDIYNLLIVSLTGDAREQPAARILFDHHAAGNSQPPHPIPAYPLPYGCWDGEDAIVYTTWAGLETKTFRVAISDAAANEVSLDDHEQVAGLSPAMRQLVLTRKLAPEANSVLQQRLTAEDRVITWTNEGFQLEGTLTLPPEEVAQPPYPLVLYPHGGPHSRSTQGFSFTSHVLANAGYAVFQPNFRGSAGYGKAFLDANRNDLGGGDMRDILAGINKLVDEQLIDPQRQFVYGISYGGFMTSWLVGHTKQFRAAVAQNAVTEMNVMWGLSDIQSWTEYEHSGLPWQVADSMRQRSPFAHANQINTPTLILHSRDDRRCPLPMGQMFHQSLLARGVATQMVIYPDEGHGIRQPLHQVDVLRRVLAWFKQHDPSSPVKIITLGDSITKGVRLGVTAEETFASQLQELLRRQGLAAEISNVGIGGERTDQALERLEQDVIAAEPRMVTIMYGTNDSYVDAGQREPRLTEHQYRDNLVQLVERLRRAGIQPLLMTEPRWSRTATSNGIGEHPNQRLERYVALCRDVARELRVPLVDHFAHWTKSEQEGQDLDAWTTDTCHPNPDGHRHLAEQIAPVLGQLLGAPSR